MPDKPLPTNEADWNVLITNLALKLPNFAAALGIATEDTNFLTKQAPNFAALITITAQVSDFKESFTAFKNALMNGDPKAAVPPIPAITDIVLPNVLASGIIPMVKAIIRRIKDSDAYNETIGEALGLADSGPAPFNPDLLFAELKVAAKANGKVEISFSKQGQDAMRVEFKRKADTGWTLAGIYTSSPGIHDAPSVPPGDPETRQYRGVLLKKNEPIGNSSPDYTVVTTP